jgi:hypothetical protein
MRRRNKLWEALNAFITQQGGWVTSPSSSTGKPIMRHHDGFIPIDLIEIDLTG